MEKQIETLCSDPVIAATLVHNYASELVLPDHERALIESLFDEINAVFFFELENDEEEKARIFHNLNEIVTRVRDYIN